MAISNETFETSQNWINGVNATIFIVSFIISSVYLCNTKGKTKSFHILTLLFALLMGINYIFKVFSPAIASWYDEYVLYYVISPLYELVFLDFCNFMI